MSNEHGRSRFQGINGARVTIEKISDGWDLKVDEEEVVVFWGTKEPTQNEVQLQIDLWKGRQ